MWPNAPRSVLCTPTAERSATINSLQDRVFPRACDRTGEPWGLDVDEQPLSIGDERCAGPFFGAKVAFDVVVFTIENDVVFGEQFQLSILGKTEYALRIFVDAVIVVFTQNDSAAWTHCQVIRHIQCRFVWRFKKQFQLLCHRVKLPDLSSLCRATAGGVKVNDTVAKPTAF